MRLLLDTCIFLWFISGDNRLPENIREAISNTENEIFLSVISIWESIVKYQLGKLPLPRPPSEYLPEQRERHQIESLPLDEESVIYLPKLPSIHRDPFDRMLICQAIKNQLILVTVDNYIRSYPVKTM
ncbi:MAG: type II toxin-antitoxin system VapC family toxin [Candidatus Omnitrophota bacterium]